MSGVLVESAEVLREDFLVSMDGLTGVPAGVYVIELISLEGEVLFSRQVLKR